MRDYKRGDYLLIVDPKFYFGDNQVVRGTTSRDLMRINDAYNTVYAGAGNDLITIIGANNALVYGETGDDFIGVVSKVEKNPTIYGGKGNDTIRTLSDKTYADGGEDNDLFIPLDSVSRTTMIGGAGNDTFWFIESSTVTASGGDGNDVYRFDPYYLFGPYHNDVVITDISGNDTIRYDFSESSGEELSYREENGNIILEDDFGFFTITLQGGASKKSEIANVKYQSIDWSGTLGELFPEMTITGGDDEDTIEPDPTSETLTPSTLVSNYTDGLNITGTSYGDSIQNHANYVTINSGSGNDTIYTYKDGNIINAGVGDDYIYTWQGTTNVKITAGDGKDSIHVGSDGATVNGDSGDDYIHIYANSTKNTIYAGTGNDTLEMGGDTVAGYGESGNDYFYVYSNGYNQTLFGGAGSDSVYSNGDKVYIDMGADDDYIHLYSYAKSHTVRGGAGNDIIKSYATLGTLYIYSSGDGNDSISGINVNDTLKIDNTMYTTVKSGSDLIVTAGSGKITVAGGANVAFTIQGTSTGGGGDSTLISNSSNNVKVTGTSSADSIKNYGSNVTISGGAGNDTIENFANTVTINGEAGNDIIYTASISGNVINAGDGADTVWNDYSSNVTINFGAGDDQMDGGGNEYVVVYGGAGNDYLYGQYQSQIYGDEGNDSIIAGVTNSTIDGGAGNDSIWAMYLYDGEKYVSINGGAGEDTIFMFGGYNTINGGTGDDVITANTGYSFVNGNDGNDTIYVLGSNNNTYNSNNTISGGAGSDYISLDSSAKNNFIKYNSGDGNDTIVGIKANDTVQIAGTTYSTAKSGSDLIITAGSGKITVQGGANVGFTILGTLQGAPPPTVPAETVTLNSAKTSATILPAYEEETFDAADYAASLVTINATKATVDLEILGNAKNNKIYGSENNDTLYGGKGTDTLTGNGGDDTFHIVKGEGNKVIADYTEGEDLIYVEGADVETVINSATVKSGNVIFKVGTNNVTVKGGDGQEILFVDEDGNEYTYPNPDPDPETILFNTSSTSATVTAYYEDETFDAADYPNLVTINATEATVDLEILGNAKNNKIYGSENNDTLYGGKGTDTLTGNGGDDTFRIVKGEGNKVIADYTEGEDIIYVEGADVETVINSASIKSGNVIFKVGTNNVTVKGGDGQEILFVDEDGNEYTYPNGDEGVEFNASSTSATVTAYYEDETFDAADYPNLVTINATEAAVDLEILGNAKNNKIYGSENNDTLYGGKGTDTLTGNGGDDTFRIVKGEGNKVIADYTEGEDIIYVEGADVETVIESASVKSGNVIFKVGTNNVTVKGGDGQEILFTDEDGNEYTYPNPDTDPETILFNASSTSATVTAYYEDETFDAADYSKLVTIDATEAAVDLEILGNAKNNKIYGSENNDTLYGGKGTDTLTGNGGDDTFHIVKGEGNKVIADYNEGEDLIYVEGANVETVINSASVKSGNVIFKVGTNNVTVKGGSGQEILFVDEDGEEYTYSAGTSGRSALWFTEDDTNFISDTPQLDAISEPKYSVVTYPETSSEIFAQNNQDTIIAVSER